MKSKIVYLAVALALVFSLAAAIVPAGPAVAAITINVPGDYATIQAAVDAANPGDTILVAAGTYAPFTVNGKTGPLTIKSQDAANPAIVEGSQAYGTKNTIIVITDSTDINLTDLDIEGDGLEGGDPPTIANAYAVIYEDATGEVKNCTISPNTAQFSTVEEWGYAHGGHGIAIWNDDNTGIISNVTVNSCTIKEFGVSGVAILNGATATVKDNTIIGTVFNRVDWGVFQTGINVEAGYGHPTAPSTATITGNEIYDVRNTTDVTGSMCYGIIINAYMFYVASYAESTVHITGNDIHDNSVGINANHASPENAYAHFNNIYDNTIDGVLSCSDADAGFVEFDATNNWWGHASGPYHPNSNPTGEGNRVRSYNALLWQTQQEVGAVDYDPWLEAPVGVVESETITGTGTMSGTPTGGDVDIDATGDHEVTVATYTSNPGGATTFSATGHYWDVHLSDDTGVTSVTIDFCPVTYPTQIYYWDGASWAPCSQQTYAAGCVVVTVTTGTHPSLADLSGQGFGSGSPYPSVPAFPTTLAGILAAVAAGFVAFALRRRIISRKS